MIITVLAFLFTLGVLVVIHEYGHYRVAVACGVKVLRFSVGFGKVLWRRQASPDATEFVLCALPLGGYVRMLDERESPVDARELDRAFNRKPLLQRTAIVAAGPVANLLLAVLLYAAAHWIGIEEPKAVVGRPVASSLADQAGLRAGDWVRAISSDGEDWRELSSLTDLRWRLTQAAMDNQPVELQVSDRDGRGRRTLRLDLGAIESRDVDARMLRQIGLGPAFSEAVLGDVKAGGPAAAAGLRKGDKVLSVDGAPVPDAQTLRERIRASAPATSADAGVGAGNASTATNSVDATNANNANNPTSANNATRTLPAQRWKIERDGVALTVDVTPRLVREADALIGRVDAFIGSTPEMVTVTQGPIDGLLQGVERTWDVSWLTLRMLGRMLIGEASVKNLSGPLTIADYAGKSANEGLAYYLGFLALVSVSLGVLNLLPLPMLDGGHLMYYIFEGVTGRPVSDLWLARLQRGGIVVLLMMMSVALFNDVARLMGLH